MDTGLLGLPRPISFLGTSTVILQRSPAATSRLGVLNLGPGPWDGVSPGTFLGNAQGTVLAFNLPSSFNGRAIDIQSNGSGTLSIDSLGNFYWPASGNSFNLTANSTGTIWLFTSGGGNQIDSSGTGVTLQISPNINQSGSAGYTALLVNATENTTGSGAKKLLDLQVGSSSKFSVSNTGSLTLQTVILPQVRDLMTYAATITMDVTTSEIHEVTTVNATGNSTINANGVGSAGQRMSILLQNDSTSGKVITFGTNLRSAGTLTGTVNKAATVSFISDGAAWYEVGRQTGL